MGIIPWCAPICMPPACIPPACMPICACTPCCCMCACCCCCACICCGCICWYGIWGGGCNWLGCRIPCCCCCCCCAASTNKLKQVVGQPLPRQMLWWHQHNLSMQAHSMAHGHCCRHAQQYAYK